MLRDFSLGGLRPILDAVGGDQVHAVAVTAHHVSRNVVGDDPVGVLGLALCDRLLDHALGFGREADEEARALGDALSSARMSRVGRKANSWRACALLELGRRRFHAPVRDGGDEDSGVGRE